MKSYKSYATGAEVAINSNSVYALRRVRQDKTDKDAKNGNAKRNAERKQLRAEWQRDNRARNESFPV